MTYFTKPVPFKEAVEKLGTKRLAAKLLNSEQWAAVPDAIRERAFFSATIENARFLQSARNFIRDFQKGAVEKLPDGNTVLKAGGRSEFIKQMQEFCTANGMGDILPPDIGREERGLIPRIKDIKSSSRLKLIFDTNVRAANGYGWWKQGNDSAILDAFPAQRFIRGHDVAVPRPLHAANEGKVRRKDDLAFWLKMNAPDIGGFNVPWPPFGFNSGMDVEDVPREVAEQLGLIQKGEQIRNPDIGFNSNIQASLRGLDPDMKKKLQEEFGDLVKFGDDAVLIKSPTPTSLKEAATIEEVLDKVGLSKKRVASADDLNRLFDELKESRPVKAAKYVKSISIKNNSIITEKIVIDRVQHFMDFVPHEIAKKLPPLKIQIDSDLLSNNELGSYSFGVIKIKDNLTKQKFEKTIFHELMHWLHRDGPSNEFRKAIRDHFKARTAGEELVKLTRYKGFGYRDDWYDEYASVVYSWEDEPGGLEMVTRYAEWFVFDEDSKLKLWNSLKHRETLKIVMKGFFKW